MSHLFLYGPPGTGKSTVGAELADLLRMPFVDLDVEIARASGRSIPDLIAEGEATFRDAETSALFRAVEWPPSVIALGGGALLRPINRCFAEERGRIVCLDADQATLAARLSRDATPRPLLQGHPERQLADLLAERGEHYRSFPTRVRVPEGSHSPLRSPASLAEAIRRRLECLYVRVPDGRGYDVILHPGGLGGLGSELRERGLGGPVAVIADDTVARFYGDEAVASLEGAGYAAHLATFPAGEGSKTIDTVSALWRAMLDAGLARTSCVVALGGGVTGDLAGFAAATFMRGIDWVAVPTSLVAMVDASIGGKTGVDLPDGKNLAGCFHHPRLVVIDPQVLRTLAEPDRRAGLAEVLKHGVIGDPDLFAILEGGPIPVQRRLEEVIRRALAVKIRIVEDDPFERGVRATLNLGHTIGHAVEAASGYSLRHGEAVAIGLVMESVLAEALDVAHPGVADRIRGALEALELPVTIPDDVPHASIVRVMGVDKKRSVGAVHFTLPVAIGEVRTGYAVRDLREALAACVTPTGTEHQSATPRPVARSPATERRERGEQR